MLCVQQTDLAKYYFWGSCMCMCVGADVQSVESHDAALCESKA